MTYISVVKKIKITIRDFFHLKFIYINFNMGLFNDVGDVIYYRDHELLAVKYAESNA